MTAESKAQEGHHAVPARVPDLPLQHDDLEMRSLDHHVRWQDNERIQIDFPELFIAEELEKLAAEYRSEPGSDCAVRLHDENRQIEEHLPERKEREQAHDRSIESSGNDFKWIRDGDCLPHSVSLPRDDGTGTAAGSGITRKEGPSPRMMVKTRKAGGGMAFRKTREDDSWVKVKAPPKPSTTDEDWELIDTDESEEEWTLV